MEKINTRIDQRFHELSSAINYIYEKCDIEGIDPVLIIDLDGTLLNSIDVMTRRIIAPTAKEAVEKSILITDEYLKRISNDSIVVTNRNPNATLLSPLLGSRSIIKGVEEVLGQYGIPLFHSLDRQHGKFFRNAEQWTLFLESTKDKLSDNSALFIVSDRWLLTFPIDMVNLIRNKLGLPDFASDISFASKMQQTLECDVPIEFISIDKFNFSKKHGYIPNSVEKIDLEPQEG